MSGSRKRRLQIANALGLACVAGACFIAACSDSEGGPNDTSKAGSAGAGKAGGGSAGNGGSSAGQGGAAAGAGEAGEANVAGEGGEGGEDAEGGAGGEAGADVGGSGGSTAGTGGTGGTGGAPVVLVPNCVRDTNSGKKVEISASGNDGLFAAAYGPDDLLYAAGYTQPGVGAQEDRSTVVVRLTATGALDPNFGVGGVVTVNVKAMDTGLAGLGELPRGLAFQGNKIIVAGTVEAYTSAQNPTVLNNDRNLYVLRLNANGSLDTTFGDNASGIRILSLNTGVQVTNATTGAVTLSGADAQWGLNVLPDNKIIVTAATRNNGVNADTTPRTDTDFAVVRLTENGAQDTTFGLNATGVYTLDIAQASASVRTASVLDDGKLIVTGYSSYGGSQRPVIFKLLADGSALDTSFAANGVFSEPVGTAAEAYGALLQPTTKKLVTVGYGRATSANTSSDILSIRLNPNGVLDTTYGATATPGRTWFDVGGLGDNGRAIVLSDERPVLLGGGSLSSGQQDAVIAVLSVNGLPLTSFGSPYGCTAYDFGTVGDFFWAGAVARDGKIAAVGLTGHGTGSTDDTDGILVLIDKP